MGLSLTTKKKTAPAPEPEQGKTSVLKPGPKVIKKAMIATADKTHPDGSEVNEQEVVGIPDVPEPSAEVVFKLGMTKNLGDFNSLRFDVSLTVPCSNTAEAIEEAYDFAKEWVDQKLTAINDETEEVES